MPNITWPAKIITRAGYYSFLKDPDATNLDDEIDFWLPSVDKSVRQYCGREFRQYEEAAFTLFGSDTGDPTAATVAVTETTLSLVAVGGTNFAAGTTDLTLATYTLTELVAAITALDAWTATIDADVDGTIESVNLTPAPVQSCLTEETAVTLGVRVDETELFDGGGESKIRPARIPITSVTSLYDDTDRLFTDSGDEIDSTDYVISTDGYRIELDGLTFANGLQNVRLIYRGGWAEADIEEDLKTAAYMLLSARRSLAGKEHISSEVEAVDGTTFSSQFTGDLPFAVRNILSNYRRYGL
jgi:hypothetical protein